MSDFAARFLDARHAFDAPITRAIVIAIAALLAVTPLLVWILVRLKVVDATLRRELVLRWASWLVIATAVVVPILLGSGWTIVGIGVLSLLCYREFARATGLFREKMVSLVVVLGIVGVTFASLDHWYGLFTAVVPFTIGLVAVVAILRDEPKGYIQRVALGVFGFALFGSCLGQLGFLANEPRYRPVLLLVCVSVALNDVFAYIAGKSLGRRKLAPNTSPKKTVAGAIGALACTTALVVVVGRFVFAGTVLESPVHLVIMGVMISALGQLGDLMLSSIKRDLGIKDMAVVIPGHGGLLDRFDSVILVSPAIFHYYNYFVGVGALQPMRLITGG